jgi:hypothetical protein
MMAAALEHRMVNEWFVQATTRAAALRAQSARLTAWSRELRQAGTRRREGPALTVDTGDTVAFRLEGVVAGHPVEAQWSDAGLVVSEELLTRADLVVRLGEEFAHPDGSTITASLSDGPLRALLTVMRACDVVHFASIDLAAEDPPPVEGRTLTAR